jgi:8-oxo-dGTP diphosphatase
MDDGTPVGRGRTSRYWNTVTSDRPLYQRDAAAWQAYLAEGNRTQPRKRVSADMLLRDEHGHVLLVDPQYKPDWDLPGGMAEANEAPVEAARREIREELGLRCAGGRLLVVDWTPPHGPWDDGLAFVFDGGVVGRDDRARMRLADGELNGFRFVPATGTAPLLRPYVERRLQAALAAARDATVRYLHDGRPV